MDLHEASFWREVDLKFRFRVFGCNLNFRRVAVACWTGAKARVPRVFIFGVDGVSAPPGKAFKTIFALISRFLRGEALRRVGPPTGKPLDLSPSLAVHPDR
jgi:hypothetical protein